MKVFYAFILLAAIATESAFACKDKGRAQCTAGGTDFGDPIHFNYYAAGEFGGRCNPHLGVSSPQNPYNICKQKAKELGITGKLFSIKYKVKCWNQD